MTDREKTDGEWMPSEEFLFLWNRDINALNSPKVTERLHGISGVLEKGRYEAVPKLKELLDDDAPVVSHDVIGEVRQVALAALQRLYWITKDRLELSPVLVRKSWRLTDMREAYHTAMAKLSPSEREAVLARADEYLEQRVQPLPWWADDSRALSSASRARPNPLRAARTQSKEQSDSLAGGAQCPAISCTSRSTLLTSDSAR